MSKKTQNEIGLMLLLTIIIILTAAIGIHHLGNHAEKCLYLSYIPLPKDIQFDNNSFHINCPWKGADENNLTLLKDDAFPKHPLKNYQTNLRHIARLLDNKEEIRVSFSPLWMDEAGLIIHIGEKADELSYAIDPNKGQIIGAGIPSVAETDSDKQITTVAELKECIDYYFTDYLNPLAEFRIHQSAYNSLLNINPTGRPKNYDPYDQNFSYSYPETDITLALWSLPRQVSYYQNVLTVIFQEEAQYYILHYDPNNLRVTSFWLQER